MHNANNGYQIAWLFAWYLDTKYVQLHQLPLHSPFSLFSLQTDTFGSLSPASLDCPRTHQHLLVQCHMCRIKSSAWAMPSICTNWVKWNQQKLAKSAFSLQCLPDNCIKKGKLQHINILHFDSPFHLRTSKHFIQPQNGLANKISAILFYSGGNKPQQDKIRRCGGQAFNYTHK